MRDGIESAGAYEHLLTVNILLFLEAIKLYGKLGQRIVINPGMIRNVKIQTGIRNIITTIEICGNGMERLPVPPPGAESPDRRFHDLGKEIIGLAEILKRLASATEVEVRNKSALELQDQSGKIKADFRQAIEDFDTIYPGRLSKTLQLMQKP